MEEKMWKCAGRRGKLRIGFFARGEERRRGKRKGSRGKANMLAPTMTAACNSRRRTLGGRKWGGKKALSCAHTHTNTHITRGIIEGEGCVFHGKPPPPHTHTKTGRHTFAQKKKMENLARLSTT